jgi:hypothetical protein
MKAVLCALVFLVVFLCCGFGVAEEYRYDFPVDSCECGGSGMYLIRGGEGGLNIDCVYSDVKTDRVDFFRMLEVKVTFWTEEKETKRVFDSRKDYLLKNDFVNCEKDCVVVENVAEQDRVSFISRGDKAVLKRGAKDEKEFWYKVERHVYYDDYAFISIKGTLFTKGEVPDEDSVISFVDSYESCMKKNIDSGLNDGTSKYKGRLLVEGKPMKNIVVYSEKDAGDESKYTTTNGNGEFSINVNDVENFDFVVEMIYREKGHDYFRLIGDSSREEAIKLIFEVRDLKIDRGVVDMGVQKEEVNVDLDSGKDIFVDEIMTKEEGLIGPFINYIHFSEVLEYYKDFLKVDLTKRTLDILLYAGRSASYNQENDRSWILMSGEHSDYESEYRPFVAYHEFSHYVQHMLYGEVFEESLKMFNVNHGGYANPDTSDSFQEGFASFMPVVIANHYGRYWTNDSLGKRASLYPLAGSLEVNWNAWERQGRIEEIAVAGVLWDLYDGKEESDKDSVEMKEFLKGLFEDMIKSYDVDKDGALNRKEFLFARIMTEINDNYNDYLEFYEIEKFNDSEFIEMIKKGKGADEQGGLSVSDFWDFMVSNWKMFDDEWKVESPEEYNALPEKITADLIMSRIENEPDDDGVSLKFEDIWGVLKKPHSDFGSVYDSFVKLGEKKRIDDVFISHGFFVEDSKGNDFYDVGEPYLDRNSNGKRDGGELYADLGEMNFNGNEVVGRAANYNRLTRKSYEELEGEYVKVNKEILFYEIIYVVYGDEYFGLKIPSDVFKIRARNEDGLIYVPMIKDARVEIVPEGVEVEDSLIFYTREFESGYEEILRKGYFKEKDFEYEGEVVVYKNPFENSGRGFVFWFGWIFFVGVIFGIFRNKKFLKKLRERF